MLAVILSTVVVCSAARAQAPAASVPREQPGQRHGTYLLYGLGLFVPPEGGRLGLAGSGEIAHDYPVGRLALASGLRLSAYFGDDESLALGMITLRCLLPLEQASLFLGGGIGPAYRSAVADLGVAVQLAGGLQIAVSSRVAVGAEASYLQLTSGAFRELSVGPLLRLSL